jgi:hypothetical protein
MTQAVRAISEYSDALAGDVQLFLRLKAQICNLILYVFRLQRLQMGERAEIALQSFLPV